MSGRIAAFFAVLALAGPAFAQKNEAETGRTIISADVYGEDLCPVAKNDEIVVCKRLPEAERYRLPKRFREASPRAGNTAWANRVEQIDDVGRVAGGLPNTCSVVGTGGQTGCTQQAIREWYNARRGQQRAR